MTLSQYLCIGALFWHALLSMRGLQSFIRSKATSLSEAVFASAVMIVMWPPVLVITAIGVVFAVLNSED